MTAGRDRWFLGGRDLEMVEIARLLAEAGAAAEDRCLTWGARASDHGAAVAAALARGETPVLVELAPDLPEAVLARCVLIDHHGALAGADRPSALRRAWARLGADPARWTRWRALVAANDVGHIAGLRAAGAADAEIRAVRDADRAAQGVTAAEEAEARRALAAAEQRGGMLVARIGSRRAGAVADFADPVYGGPGVAALAVLMPGEIAFFGDGARIARVADWPGSWRGGALPARGYWGARVTHAEADALLHALAP